MARHLEILRQARREGIAAAYAQRQETEAMLEQILRAFLGMLSIAAVAALLAAMPDEQWDRLERELEERISQQPPEEQEALRQVLEELRRLRRSRRGG